MTEHKLAPCPFPHCGSDDVEMHSAPDMSDPTVWVAQVDCIDCCCSGPLCEGPDKETVERDAADKWNARRAPATTTEETE